MSTPEAATAADRDTAAEPPETSGRSRRLARWGARLLLAVVGAVLGILLFARVEAPIGPFDATVAFVPVGGGARVDIPPLGALGIDAYEGPLRLDVELRQVNGEKVEALALDPTRLDGIEDRVTADLRAAVGRLAWKTAAAALAGAAATALLVLRRPAEALIAAGLTGLLVLGTAGLGAVTWRPQALTQPTYSGLLVNTNNLIGRAEDIATRFDAYRGVLGDLVVNVSRLYAGLSALQQPPPGGEDPVTLLHVSDLHLNPTGFDLVREVVSQFEVDAVLDTGDITDLGSRPENLMIASLGRLPVPYLYVRGNHDTTRTAELIDSQANATVLDGSATTVAGLQIVGAPDPRYAPRRNPAGPGESLQESGEELADYVRTLPEPPVLAMVHHPDQAGPLDGVVPLVLAGHTHERRTTVMDDGTLLTVQGSTGGAGLRGFRDEDPTPLTTTVLYLDRDTGELAGYDDITLGGLGETEVTIQRTVLGIGEEEATDPPPDDDGTGGSVDGRPPGELGVEPSGPG